MKLLGCSLLLFLAACSHAPTSEETEVFNARLAELKFKTTKNLNASSDTRIPLKAGQWVAMLTELKEGNKDLSISTFKVLKVNRKSVTFEMETFNATDPEISIVQYQVENFPNFTKLSMNKQEVEKLISEIKIKKIITKNGNGPIQEIPVALKPLKNEVMKTIFANGYRLNQVKKESCHTKFIQSSSCAVFDFEARSFGYTTTGVSYSHSEVPITSFVRSDSNLSSTEVINFGLTGAKSSL